MGKIIDFQDNNNLTIIEFNNNKKERPNSNDDKGVTFHPIIWSAQLRDK